jgi:hypothetical protein
MKLKRLGRLSEGLQLEGAFGVGFKTLYALKCTAFFFVHGLPRRKYKTINQTHQKVLKIYLYETTHSGIE